jgi:hypothetical protein
MQNRWFRVINKSKDGALLKLSNSETRLVDWDTYNSMEKSEDGKAVRLSETQLKDANELIDKLNTLFVYSSKVNPTIGDLGVIGSITTELQEKYGCSMPWILGEMQKRRELMTTENLVEKVRRRKAKRIEDAEVVEDNQPKATFGDLPELQKLKEQMSNN